MKSIKKIIFSLLLISCNQKNISVENKVKIFPLEQSTNIEIDIEDYYSRNNLLQPIFNAIEKQKSDLLPFDEPKIEYGQEDGKLRGAWLEAYYKKQPTYSFNDVIYYTFYNGKPHPPQVCADFIVDTLDIAGGTWYNSSIKYPFRKIGKIDTRNQMLNEGLSPRQVTALITFFKNHSEDFEIIFDGNSPEIGNVKNTKEWLKKQNVQLGDLIFLRGKVPWDYKEEHSHSLIVTNLDDEGYVEKVTGNPIFPVERKLIVETNRTPRRKVVSIIRLKDSFLKKLR